jgi:predicted Fe-Mo cluster-binding NifX family protein
MRIAIPLATGKLAVHFGHCEEFALVDVDDREKKIIGEVRIGAPPHEPGRLPTWLASQGAEVIIAGGMGSRAQALFAGQGIRVIVGAAAAEPRALARAFLERSLATGTNLCDH